MAISTTIMKQVELSMDIFKEKTHGFKKALFLFDNATTHQKRAPNAPSARKMLKGPKLGWTPRPGGLKMLDTILPDGSIQSFYFPDDHPSMPGQPIQSLFTYKAGQPYLTHGRK